MPKLTQAFAITLILLGTVRAFPGFVTMLSGGTVERPGAVVAQVLMALICAVYVALSVRSFMQARRARAASA